MEQIWGARRLVTVVLPLVALASGWAIARRDRMRSRRMAGVGLALIALAVALGLRAIAPVAGRPIQAGGAVFARAIGDALPPQSKVVVAKPLDWLHLAPELWLAGHEVVVARDTQLFPAALAWWLRDEPERDVFALSGAVVAAGEPVDARALLPGLPDGWTVHEVRSFRWPARTLERTTDRPPRTLLDLDTRVTLYRLEPPQ
jgi:hypothetical protein